MPHRQIFAGYAACLVMTIVVIFLSILMAHGLNTSSIAAQTTVFQEKLTTYTHYVNGGFDKLEEDLAGIRAILLKEQDERILYLKILILQSTVKKDLAKSIAGAVYKYADIYDQDPDLVLSIIQQESGFSEKHFRSSAKAIGPMQVLEGKDKTLCKGLDIHAIEDNIHCGIKIYSHYNQEYGHYGVEATLAAYNRGPNPIDIAVRDDKDVTNIYARNVMNTYGMLKELDNLGE